MRSPLFLFSIALLAFLTISWWLNPVREAALGGDATAHLAQLAGRDGELAAALSSADRGDPTPLLQWINRTEPLQRQQIGLLILRSTAGTPPDDRALYRQRHRLLPFTAISTGNSRLDLELDNAVAYALVAGTRTPTKEDLGIALTLAKRLEVPAQTAKEHGWFDTIGCVYFVSGDATKAVAAFRRAVTLAEAEKIPDEQVDLYRRRVAASERLGANSGELLPLDWPTP